MSRFSKTHLDPAIVARARRGEMKAHEMIYRAYSAPVFNLAARMTGSRVVAEDILQETFLEVLRSLGGFREEASLSTWIRRVAVSKCLMHQRAAWERRARNESDGAATIIATTQAPATAPGLQLDLEKALAALPEESRAVVILHDVEGMTHEEIARLMDRSVSYSKSRLARAHGILRELLEPPVAVSAPPLLQASAQ